MLLDPEKVRLCREWLIIAESDLRAALVLKQASPPFIDQAPYQCQQCAEKTLKTFLARHETPFRNTHTSMNPDRNASRSARPSSMWSERQGC